MEKTGYDYLAKMKCNVGQFKSNGVYWCDSKFIGFDSDFRRRHGIPFHDGVSPSAITYRTSLIPYFELGKDKLLIIRGGIGDLLALSVLHDIAPEVIILTTKSLFPILDWWRTKPRLKHFNEPLFTVKYPKKIEEYCSELSQQNGDHVIAQGSRENWYRIIYRSVGYSDAEIDKLAQRPQLQEGPLEKNRLSPGALLIVHKATSINRSADPASIVEAILQWENWPGQDLYWYDENRRLIRNGQPVDNKQTKLTQYLTDLYHADFVISVDTSAIHFREGIRKPALGIYTSFSAESRCSGYKFTRSMNMKSPCPYQPCFLNFKPCGIIREGETHAPCLGTAGNPDFVSQLKNELAACLKEV